MVHAKAAVTPSSRKVMEEASPEYTSLANVHEKEEPEESVVVTSTHAASRPTTHRRHNSLFSNASAPVDLLDYPSMRRAPSSKSDHGSLQKSTSANFNWKLGEFWSKFRGASVKSNDSRSTSLSIDTATQSANPKAEPIHKTDATLEFHKTEAKVGFDTTEATLEFHKTEEKIGFDTTEAGVKALGFHKTETIGVHERKPPEWKKGKDVDIVSPTSTSKSKSLHFTSLNLFSSSKFSSSNDLDTPVERSGQLESSEETVPNYELSSKWREIQGANYWNGLMDPFDLDLRKEILRYGEFAQLAYDNFECNAHSKYAGTARNPKHKLLENLHKESCGYEVTRYLYATSDHPLPGVLLQSSSAIWDRDSNWMGYVAVATDPTEIERLGRRDIVVAWRGAARTIEWLVDAQTQMTPIRIENHGSKIVTEIVPRPKVEQGFWSLYTCKRPAAQIIRKSASEQVITELRRLLKLYKGDKLSITLTGHNLGGALAILTAYEIAERGLNKPDVPVTTFTFGAPHVGDGAFRRRFEELELKVLRVVNVQDVVPKSIANFYPLWGSSDAAKHVGVELQLNHRLSPYLKSSRDPQDWHNLECYLHHVDGYQGPKAKSFELVTGRDLALVNKYADVLQEQFCIPAHWWHAENKGLALSSEGRWVEPDRAPQDAPSLANRERFV